VLLIKFNKWTDKTVNDHNNGFIQTIYKHHINVFIFCFTWKILEWDEYINHWESK
jgi:hypothetical protein